MGKRGSNIDYKDPDFIEALVELDKEFPGAEIDDSMNNYIDSQKNKRTVLFFVYSLLTSAYVYLIVFCSLKIELNNITLIISLVPLLFLLINTFYFAMGVSHDK